MQAPPAERRADRAWVGAVPVRGDAVGGDAGCGPGRAEEGLGRRHVAVLTEHGVDQSAVPVDGPIEITPATPHLQIRLVDMPAAAASTALAPPPLSEFAGQDRRELGLPVADRLVTEDDAADQEHLAEVAQGEAVAQAP